MAVWAGSCWERCGAMGTKHPPREAWLDGLKGFGILLVILGHVLSGYLDAWTFPEAYESFYHVRTWIYSFHMPLFYLLSGYTFTLAYYRAGKLRRGSFVRQICNLIWIYVVFVLLQWGVKQLVPDMVNEPYDLEDLRRIFVEPLGNFWYIYVLTVLYLLGAAVKLPRRHPLWLVPLAALSVYVAAIHLDWTELTLYRIAYHCFFFAVGSVLCRHRDYLTNQKLMGLSSMLLATAAYFYIVRYTRNWYAYWKVIIALGTCYVNVYLFRRWPRLSGWKPFQLCGRYCLELYLLHTFFTGGLRTLLPMLGVTGPWCNVLLNFAVSTGVCLLLAVLAGRCHWLDLLFRPARLALRLWEKRT